MKLKLSFRDSSHWRHTLHAILLRKKMLGVFGVLLAIITLTSVFFILKGSSPSVSELAFVEHSPLGPEAGSVVPASCDSDDPFARWYGNERSGSHFRGDCRVKCNPHRNDWYDPYFDEDKEACNAIGNFESVNPTTCKVNGWAFDSSNASKSIKVNVYKDGVRGTGTFVTTCSTTILRQGVNDAWDITGKHGFSCALPRSYVGGGGHNLYLHAMDISGSPNDQIDHSPKWLDCIDPVCTGDLPDGAILHTNDDDGLAADTPHTYSAANTAGTKCQFYCDDGDTWTGTECRPAICTGSKPVSSTIHTGDRTGLLADTPYTYSAANTGAKCQFRCNSGYIWDNPICRVPRCTGSIPDYATGYAGDATSTLLVADTPYTYSAANTATRCQFHCNTGYVWDAPNSRCVYRLKICKNSCSSGIERTTSGFTMDSGDTEDLKACYNSDDDCGTASGDVTNTAVWSETNAPQNAISFPTRARVLALPFAGGGTRAEGFNVIYNGITKSSRVEVTCIPRTCDFPSAVAVTNTYCPEIVQNTGVSNGCSGTLTCPGTRDCGYNLKEVAP